MVEAARRFRDGGPAFAASVPKSHLRSFEGVVPKETDWRTLGGTPRAAAGTTEPAAA
jgi:phthalate 4,5-dioxygenase oxygenase subunit